MTVFVDTNVLLDVLGKREPFFDDAAALWTLVERRLIEGVISAVSVTNIYYIVRRLESRAVALKSLRKIRRIFRVAACDESVIDRALQSDLKDFEDAVQLATAEFADAACLVTRNPAHFANDSIPVLTPAEFLTQDDVARLFD